MSKYEIIGANTDNPSVVMVSSDGELLTATCKNPRLQEIIDGLESGQDVEHLFAPVQTILKGMNKLSERVSIIGNKIFFDGDEIRKPITQKIMSFLESGTDGWQPLVAFMEKVAQNPRKESRNMLYDFLDHNQFTITDDGNFIGYKGVISCVGDDVFRSTHAGNATVNGVPVKNDYVRQTYGDTVEMPRSTVEFDPYEPCSVGLHVSNLNFAKGFGDSVISVLVNPRDVVSVPSDVGFQKVRVCRYVVLDKQDAPTEEMSLYTPVSTVKSDDDGIAFGLDDDDWEGDFSFDYDSWEDSWS